MLLSASEWADLADREFLIPLGAFVALYASGTIALMITRMWTPRRNIILFVSTFAIMLALIVILSAGEISALDLLVLLMVDAIVPTALLVFFLLRSIRRAEQEAALDDTTLRWDLQRQNDN